MTTTETTPVGAGESSPAPDGSAVPEVHLTLGRMMAQCPVCKGLWTKDCKPEWRTFPDDRIMPTGPHCPHCGATVRIFIDLPNTEAHGRRRRTVNALVRHISHEMIEGPRFKLAFLRGDDAWASSIDLDFTWRGRHYWHCWLLPWWPAPNMKAEG